MERKGKDPEVNIILNRPFSLPPCGQHISYWPFLKVAETPYLAFVTLAGVMGTECHTGAPVRYVCGRLGSPVMWMLLLRASVITRFYSYLMLLTIADFRIPVFFHLTFFPCILVLVPHPATPIKKRTSIVKLWIPSGKLVVTAVEGQ